MPAGTTTVGTTPVKLFDSADDDGKATTYMVHPSGGKILVGVVGMPGQPDADTDPKYPVADDVREYLRLDRFLGGGGEGMITQVWAKAVSGSVDVDHGVSEARK